MQQAAAATRLTGSRGATKQMLAAQAARLHQAPTGATKHAAGSSSYQTDWLRQQQQLHPGSTSCQTKPDLTGSTETAVMAAKRFRLTCGHL
jgi:hypothetical protein